MFSYRLDARTELCLFQPQHAPALLNFVIENRAHLDAWLAWSHEIQTLDDAVELLRECVQDFARDQVPDVGIWYDNILVGGVFFYPLDHRIRAAEFGYWLGEKYTGRGLMSRTLRVVLAYLFDTLKLNRVSLGIEPENTPSIALAERLGFACESVRRDGWFRDGHFVDVAVYSLLAEEWYQANGS